ncbi:MAG: type III pantothenate kinase [Gemmatimonadota bacterium]
MAGLLLAIDVGNTDTTLGLFEGRRLLSHWRLHTDLRRTPDELAFLLRGLVAQVPDAPERIERGCIGSVVPPLDPVLTRAFFRAFQVVARFFRNCEALPVRLLVDEPLTVGADRILNTLAASTLYHVDTIAVDLGTATTFDCITAEGDFLGGVIAPGPRSGLEGLALRASKLPFVELGPPAGVIGKRTEACLRSGGFYMVVDGIDGIVRRIREEWEKPDALVVATGGLAPVIAPQCETVDFVEPYLTLYGLEIADRLLRGT